MYVFPGRLQVRPCIDFDKFDKQKCSKNYFKGISAITSFLTVQYLCAQPKVLGFVLSKESEPLSTALKSIMTHLSIPPRHVWYNNACNVFDSAITPIPWFLRSTMFVVDRLHFTAHTCSNVFNGNVHRVLDAVRSAAAEVINSMIDKCVHHISYLKGDKILPFVKVLFGTINACAYVRGTNVKTYLEGVESETLLLSRFPYCCMDCKKLRGTDAGSGTPKNLPVVDLFTTANRRVPLNSGEGLADAQEEELTVVFVSDTEEDASAESSAES